MPGPLSKVQITMSDQTRVQIQSWLRCPTMPSGLVRRARAVLLLEQGGRYAPTARQVGKSNVRPVRKAAASASIRMKLCSSSYVSANRQRRGEANYVNGWPWSIPSPMLVTGKDDALVIAGCVKISSICAAARLSTICTSLPVLQRFLPIFRLLLDFLTGSLVLLC